MRQLNAALLMTLDGVVEAPQDWQTPYFDDEIGGVIGRSMAESDALLMGRGNYEEWAEYWPSQSADENPFAGFMNETPKFVASTTLDSVDWNNTSLLEGDVPSAVKALKEEPGKDITISGSPTLVRSLLEAGLVDELRLMIHPIVLGKGKRLFEDGEELRLELADSRTFATGVVYAVYRPAGAS
jgi:dihydrofolate reductase